MNESILLIEPRYTKDDAEDILALADEVLRDFLKVESDGVWVSHHHPVGLSWVPYMELEGLDAPNPRTHPALPFPFSASQLAAFMLDGIGAVIREYIGEWVNGPSEGVLERLPDQSRKAAEVLRLAYRAYQVADTSVKSSMADGHCGTGHGSPVWRKQMVLALFKVSTDTGHKARQFAVLGMTEEGGMESPARRQERRYNMCVDAGMRLPKTDYERLPNGINRLAETEGVSRQAFSADVKKYINKLVGKGR